MRLAWLGAGAALALGLVVGCSQASKTDAQRTSSSRQAIQGGTTDTTHTFAVGVCGDFGAGGQCAYRCSGALITPNLVVTARHCVQQAPEEVHCDQNPSFGGQQANSFHVTTNVNMLSSTGKHGVQQIIVPPDSHICGNDIALLILSDMISASEAKPIVPGVQYDMGDPRYGNLFTAIGYGAIDPSGDSSGTRRIKENIQLLCIPGDQYIPCPAEAQINANEFVGGDGTCQGDSGSSAYEQKSFNADINTVVSWGVLSRGGASADGTTCQGSIYTRLDKWRDLIIQTANQASNNWSLYPKPVPDWTGPFVPIPTKDAGAKDAGKKGSQSGLGLGEACTTDSECASKVCAQLDSGGVCSAACDDDSQCSDGYTCQDSLCLVAPDTGNTTQAAPGGGSSSGCSVSRSEEPVSAFWLVAAVGAVGLAASRRRRSPRA